MLCAVAVALASAAWGAETPGGANLFDLVQQKAAPGEYQFQTTKSGFAAINTPNRLCAEFTAGGVRVSQYDAVRKQAGGDLFAMRLAGFGREGAVRDASDTRPELSGAAKRPSPYPLPQGEGSNHSERIEYARAGVTEWYTNNSKGIEQGFDVAARPDGAGRLCVRLATDASVEDAGSNAVRLLAGGRRLRFGDLVATDAKGRKLEARLAAASSQTIAISVDDNAAAYPITIDPTLGDENWVSGFNLRGMNDRVLVLAYGGAGDLYACGWFTTAGGIAANYIAKWDGANWSALGSGMNGGVYALASDGAGNVYAGGDFTTAGGVVASKIAKWDGANWSALGSGMDDYVGAITCDGAGNLYAGGAFTVAGGVAANFIAKWDGLNWSTLGSGMGWMVRTLVLDGAGNLFAGGSFWQAGGVSARYIAKWDGMNWAALGSGMDYDVCALACDGAGNLYAGGEFTTAGGVSARHVAKWDGMNWSALGSGVDATVYELACRGAGNLYAGGDFTMSGAMSVYGIAKWNGANWSGLSWGLNGRGSAIAFDDAGNLYAAGSFTAAGGVAASRIAKWDGANWSALGSGSGMNDPVYALVSDGAGNLYAGGRFITAGGVVAVGIAKWNGANWSVLGSGLNGFVSALARDGAGNLYAGGYFTTAGGAAANHIAKWNGSNWSALGSGVNSDVYELASDGAGNLYAGGAFTTAGGVAANYIAKWDGANWSALGSGMDNSIVALTCDGAGNLYAGGAFTTAGGVAASYIAKWDGANWSALGSGMNYSVSALAGDAAGNLYAGGSFTTAGGVAANCIAKWDGANWSTLGLGMNDSVGALTLDGAGNLYAGGAFTTAGGVAASKIAKWDGANWYALGSGMNNYVSALRLDGAGNLYVGGSFTAGGSKSSSCIAKYLTGGAPVRFDVEAETGGSIVDQNAGTAFGLRIVARDSSNCVVTNYTGTVDITSAGALSAGGGTTASFVNGVLASHSVTISDAGSFTITATRTGGTEAGTSNSFVVRGPLEHFKVTASDGGAIGERTAGTSFSVRVVAQDAANNTLTTFSGTVDITSSGTLSAGGGTTASFVNGVLASHSMTITNTGAFTITATRTGGTEAGTSNTFTVNAGPLDHFDLVLASPQTKGVAFAGTNTLTAKDQFGNTITGFDASANAVTISANSPLTGTVSGLGSAANNLLNRAADFANGVADLTWKMTYTGNAAAGTFTAATASGKTGTSGTVTIRLAAPTIATHPAGVSVSPGQAVSLSVTANGEELTYQWRKDGVDIAGATQASLSIASAQVGDAGSYVVVVSNSGGSVTSNPATVQLLTAPQITSPLTASAVQGEAFTYRMTATGTAPVAFVASQLPPGLSYSGDTISGVPSVGGVAAITLQALNYLGTDTETLRLTITKPAGAPNGAPVFVSQPNGSSTTGVAGQAVTFTAAAGDPDGDLPGYTWDFGDGTTGTGSSATHTYTQPGIYHVTVTVWDGAATTTAELSFAVSAADGGVGTDDGGDPLWTEGAYNAFVVKTASLKFNFTDGTKDGLKLAGTIPVAKFFKPATKTVVVLIGDMREEFVLDPKGKGTSGANTLQMRGKMKNGVFKATPAKFSLSMKGRPLFDDLEGCGFVATDTGKEGVRVSLPVIVLVEQMGYQTTNTVLYKATAGKGGAAKGVK
jgi:hypothetical protein